MRARAELGTSQVRLGYSTHWHMYGLGIGVGQPKPVHSTYGHERKQGWEYKSCQVGSHYTLANAVSGIWSGPGRALPCLAAGTASEHDVPGEH